MKLFRRIANEFAGRQKVVDEPTSYSEVMEMLNGLNGETKIDVYHYSYEGQMAFRGCNTGDISKFVKEEFQPRRLRYFKANHQVFSDEEWERHYVDLQSGFIRASIGNHEYWGKPFMKATLDYVLQRQK